MHTVMLETCRSLTWFCVSTIDGCIAILQFITVSALTLKILLTSGTLLIQITQLVYTYRRKCEPLS